MHQRTTEKAEIIHDKVLKTERSVETIVCKAERTVLTQIVSGLNLSS